MKIISAKEAVANIHDGATIMVGGFMANGTPECLMDALVEKGVRHLTLICNDTGVPGSGTAKLISAGAVDRLIATHIGLNPETGKRMNEGSIEVTLMPQGTFAECIRAAGAGLGGVLTPTGLGTEVAVGKEVLNVDGREYLLEKPIHADFALIGASTADEAGNLFFKGTTRNFQPMMAMAAETVIAAAKEIVKVGMIPAESIVVPGILVDFLVGGE